MEWTVLVPVKRLQLAKSRLPLPATTRAALMAAMAADTVAAALAAPGVARVAVVTGEVTGWWGAGAEVLPDAGGGLTAAVRAAARGFPGPVAVLAGDLPALRAAELGAALRAAAAVSAGVVADAPGGGTVLLTAREGRLVLPSYGVGSLLRHVALGAADLTGGLLAPGLRRDVDTPGDWAEALVLGVGTASAAFADVLPLAG